MMSRRGVSVTEHTGEKRKQETELCVDVLVVSPQLFLCECVFVSVSHVIMVWH